MIAYKLLKRKKSAPGKVFPLYVLTDTPTPFGEWIDAKEGPMNENGKVKSALGPLAFRPGFHCSDFPLAIHIGIKGESGKIEYMNPDHVWCEVEYSDKINYQEEANKNGMKNGKFNPRNAFLDHIPTDGYYRYKTSPMMLGEWIIAGSIKINRILSDEEVEEICQRFGYHALPKKVR